MAEFVERRIEEIVPEIEEMERMGLLAPKEIKKLIIKRKEYEYRIARRTKSKVDFINYVEYEKKLLELLKIRRMKINCYEKQAKIEGGIARRTIKQLRYMSRIWHGDLDVWALRIEFAKYRQWKEEVSVAYTEQLRFHSNREWLWVALARWEVEGRKNFDRARKVLLSMAPLYHPKSITIRRELFRLELLYLESLRIKKENDNIAGCMELNNENKDKVLECGVARVVYQDSVEQIPQPELYVQFYRVAHNFEFAHSLRDEIYRALCKAFPNDDSVWKLRAQRAVLGLTEQLEVKVNEEETSCSIEEEKINDDNLERDKNKDESVKEDSEDIRNEGTKDDDDDNQDEAERDEESQDNSESKDLQKQNEEASSSSEEESEGEGGVTMEESEDEDEETTVKIEDEDKEDEDSDSDSDEGGDTMEESEDEDEETTVKIDEDEDKEDEDSDEGYIEEISLLDEVSANTPKTAPQQSLETLFSTFEKAMQETNGEFANVYVTELLPLLYQCWGINHLRNMIFKKINTIYKKNKNKLSPLNYFVVSTVISDQSGSLENQRRVLENGLKQHPEHKQLQLQLLQIVARDAYTDQELKKVFDNLRISLRGQWLVLAWDMAMKNLTDREVLTQLFDEAQRSTNNKISKAMRTRHLHWKYKNAGIVGCRKLYNKIQGVPPFSAEAHSTMLKLELQQKTVAIDVMRRILDNAVRQFGETHPGVWLTYIYFEKTKGDPIKVSGLYTRAEATLNSVAAQTFREINITIRETLNKNVEAVSKTEDDNERTVLVVGTEAMLNGLNPSTSQHDEEVEERRLNAAALVNVVAEVVIMSHSQHRERAAFFNNLRCFREKLKTDSEAFTESEESVWEAPLNSLVGNKVSLVLRKIKVSKEQQIKDDPFKKIKKDTGMIAPRFMKRYELSDQLQVEGEEVLASADAEITQDINKILKESETLKPGFMNRRRVKPYAVSKKKAKAIRKRQREKTSGSGWYNMKAPDITPEIQRDLEILQMRGVLNPKRHYKNSDMKVLPKFFQMGTVVDNPLDFYTNRITKKERKKTLADEIIHDEEVLRYQKRKYNEIIVKKQKKEFKHKHKFHSNKGNKGGKQYSGEKPAKKRKTAA